MELKRYSFFELIDKLYQLAKFIGGSFTLLQRPMSRMMKARI